MILYHMGVDHSVSVIECVTSVKMPTIVGILTFISMINTHLRDLKQETSLFVGILALMSR